MCSFLYWTDYKRNIAQKFKLKQAKPKIYEAKKIPFEEVEQKKELDLWFHNQISQMPHHCENCSAYLNPYAPWGAKTYIAHILPKSKFKSVMTHPLNRMFLCEVCHTNFDTIGKDKRMEMPKIKLALERLSSFSHLLTNHEEVLLEDYLNL